MNFRLLTAAALALTLGVAGCAQAPVPGMAGMGIEEDGFSALAKPVNMEAVGVARSWAKDADQVGVMINRSPKGVQDTATFVFAAKSKKQRMLIVIASKGGLTAQEVAMSDRTAQGLANAAPLTKQQGELMNSKKLFKMAEDAGLKNAEDVVVMNTRGSAGTMPIAIVTDASATHYIVMNAGNGDPITPVSVMGGKRLQVHILVIGAVVLTVAVGAAVYWAVKKWREQPAKPTPAPSGQPTSAPTPVPSASPVPTPVPTSAPASPIREVIAAAFTEQFARLDADKDGKLTMAEYLKPAADDATKRVKTKEYQEFIDRSHSNGVSKAEFLQGIERSVTHDMCGISFSMLDTNQDRGLDRGEVGKGLKDDEFQAADTNNDTKLSNGEYLFAFAKKEAIYANYYR